MPVRFMLLIIPLAAMPLPAALALTFLIGELAGALVNWAVYGFAWNRRAISPWGPRDERTAPRRPTDRLPILGWWGLRREAPIHGPRFWVRPMLVELLMGVGFAALYWWEVGRQGLLTEQFAALSKGGLVPVGLAAPTWITLATFASHALLITLMAAASLIDIDEKLIPDEVTVPGTLLGLTLATLLPMSLLPHAAIQDAAPAVGVKVALPLDADAEGGTLTVEPTTFAAPADWPAVLAGPHNIRALAIGLGCYALWCFALTPRLWRRRRGLAFGLAILLARVRRELARPPLLWIMLAGFVAIPLVWYYDGAPWAGLLTALVGMIGASALVWAVRIVGSAALRREALGFGDVLLMMMIGTFVGWQAGVMVFFLSPFAALFVGLLQLILRRDDEIYYGPFLCLATLAVVVRWGHFWNADTPLQQVFDVWWLVPTLLAAAVVLLGAMLVLWRNLKEGLFGQADSDDAPH
jgi:leader peptidase (prepilin peptidase)/N-methyltransferase